MSELIGHANAVELIRRLQTSGRMGSALLLVGAEGIGKRKIVDGIIGTGDHVGSPVRPDAMTIERQLNDKGELKKNISIEQVRELISRLSMTSFSGGQKVGIIDGADLLSIDAANALLKTLEDPMGNVLVILLSTSTANIPATVLSRCQIIHLPLVSTEEICDALAARGADREEAHEIAGLAAGRPGVALRLFENKELYRSYESYWTYLDDLLKKSLPQKLGQLGELCKKDKVELETILDLWELVLHRSQNYSLLKQLMRARQAISQNVSPILALEHAFI